MGAANRHACVRRMLVQHMCNVIASARDSNPTPHVCANPVTMLSPKARRDHAHAHRDPAHQRGVHGMPAASAGAHGESGAAAAVVLGDWVRVHLRCEVPHCEDVCARVDDAEETICWAWMRAASPVRSVGPHFAAGGAWRRDLKSWDLSSQASGVILRFIHRSLFEHAGKEAAPRTLTLSCGEQNFHVALQFLEQRTPFKVESQHKLNQLPEPSSTSTSCSTFMDVPHADSAIVNQEAPPQCEKETRGVGVLVCVMFHNEVELLAMQLTELNATVQSVAVIEAPLTHANGRKPLCFKLVQGYLELTQAKVPPDMSYEQRRMDESLQQAEAALVQCDIHPHTHHRDALEVLRANAHLLRGVEVPEGVMRGHPHAVAEEKQRDYGVYSAMHMLSHGGDKEAHPGMVLVCDVDEVVSARALRRTINAHRHWGRETSTASSVSQGGGCSSPLSLIHLDWHMYTLAWKAANKRRFGHRTMGEGPVVVHSSRLAESVVPHSHWPIRPALAGGNDGEQACMQLSASQWRRVCMHTAHWRKGTCELLWNGHIGDVEVYDGEGVHFHSFGGAKRLAEKLAATPQSEALASPVYQDAQRLQRLIDNGARRWALAAGGVGG